MSKPEDDRNYGGDWRSIIITQLNEEPLLKEAGINLKMKPGKTQTVEVRKVGNAYPKEFDLRRFKEDSDLFTKESVNMTDGEIERKKKKCYFLIVNDPIITGAMECTVFHIIPYKFLFDQVKAGNLEMERQGGSNKNRIIFRNMNGSPVTPQDFDAIPYKGINRLLGRNDPSLPQQIKNLFK